MLSVCIHEPLRNIPQKTYIGNQRYFSKLLHFPMKNEKMKLTAAPGILARDIGYHSDVQRGYSEGPVLIKGG